MRKGIHPEYVDTVVTCTCGNSFHTRSTITSGEMRVDVCSACHPFYTGKQKILDTGGRVAKLRGSLRQAQCVPPSEGERLARRRCRRPDRLAAPLAFVRL